MPAKKEIEETVLVEPKVHTMVRYIANSNITSRELDVWSVEDVDLHVSAWIERGYSLVGTHFVGIKDLGQYSNGLSGFGMLYILAKNA